MAKLLVSVRNAAEAEIALEAGADLIDVKEPKRGSPGAADVATIESVVQAVAGRVPSAPRWASSRRRSPPCWPGRTIAVRQIWIGRLRRNGPIGRCGGKRKSVDAAGSFAGRSRVCRLRAAAAPSPRDVFEQAFRWNCRGILFDTFDKSGGPLTSTHGPGRTGEMD